MDQGLALADWAGFEPRRAESPARGKLRGRGIATFLEWTGGNALEERVTVDVHRRRLHRALTAPPWPWARASPPATCSWRSTCSACRPSASASLQGDTDRANGFGSAGSRSLFTGGAAVRVASERTVDEARDWPPRRWRPPAADIEYRAGRFTVAGTDLGIGLFELAARQPKHRIVVSDAPPPAAPAGPTAATSARSRSTPTPAR
jgi:aerobic carbon-monoxide dehydrogenase large subunit